MKAQVVKSFDDLCGFAEETGFRAALSQVVGRTVTDLLKSPQGQQLLVAHLTLAGWTCIPPTMSLKAGPAVQEAARRELARRKKARG
jgi:hypothetical protein